MRIEKLSDQRVVTLFVNGNRQAFEVLYDRYWQSLYHVSYNILGEREAAKDVVQEVFVSFFENAPGRDIGNVKAYLYQSAKYQCFMQLRAGRISEKHLQRMKLVVLSNAVEDDYDAAELAKILEDGIEGLPEKCREIFFLSRVKSMPNKKIAEKLNISTKTVENQITKALKSLRMTVDKLGLLVISMFF